LRARWRWKDLLDYDINGAETKTVAAERHRRVVTEVKLHDVDTG
jgi:hypothetical protein